MFRCLSTLYQDADWSQKDLQDAIIRARNNVSNSKAGAFSPERLKYYFQELNSMENDRRKVSFTDLWGLIVEYFLQQKVKNSRLWNVFLPSNKKFNIATYCAFPESYFSLAFFTFFRIVLEMRGVKAQTWGFFTSLCFSFHIYKMGIILPPL